MDSNNRIQMVRQLIKLKYDEIRRSHIDKTLKEIEKLQLDRNFVVHGLWSRLLDGTAIVASTRPNSDPYEIVTEVFSTRRMTTLAESISERSLTISDLTVELQTPPVKQP
jgi:hypothetical protein